MSISARRRTGSRSPASGTSDLGLVLVGPETKGERIIIKGRVFDGSGTPLKDALIEIWQADADGLYNSPQEKRGKADPNFAGWGRQPTDGDDRRIPLRDRSSPAACPTRTAA